MTERITIILPSEMKYLHLVSQFGKRVAESLHQPQGEIKCAFSSTIELALSEAFTNSVKHKRLLQDESEVIITFEVEENELTVVIKDTNPRFDFKCVTAPCPDDYPESGYGLFLLKRTMDTVNYCREKGWNVITMAKKQSETEGD